MSLNGAQRCVDKDLWRLLKARRWYRASVVIALLAEASVAILAALAVVLGSILCLAWTVVCAAMIVLALRSARAFQAMIEQYRSSLNDSVLARQQWEEQVRRGF